MTDRRTQQPKKVEFEINLTSIQAIVSVLGVIGVIIYTPYFVFIELPEISLVLLKRGFEYVKEKFIYYTISKSWKENSGGTRTEERSRKS